MRVPRATSKVLYVATYVYLPTLHIAQKVNISNHAVICLYLNRQKLSKRKVLQLTRFHPKVGKTFAVLASFALKVLKL